MAVNAGVRNISAILSDERFSSHELTAAINDLDHRPSRVSAMGLFEERGIQTTKVAIESRAGVLRLVPTTPRGAPATPYAHGKRTMRTFEAPHVPYRDTLYADELQDNRPFGAGDNLDTVENAVNERLAVMRGDVEATIEHLRVGALKGKILDSEGTELHDLFVEFGVSQQTQPMELDTSGTDVRARSIGIARMIEDELGAMTATGYHAFMGRGFFDAFTGHQEVKTAFERYESGGFLRDDVRRGFPFGGITWEEYRGKMPDGTPFIPDNEAYIFPLGTGLFQNYFAPADFLDTVNSTGLPMYARMSPDQEAQRFVNIHVQSNPLPLSLRPRAVVKATIA